MPRRPLSSGQADTNPKVNKNGIKKSTTLDYPKTMELCGNSLVIESTVRVKQGGSCKTCPGAVCKVWAPDAEGEYNTKCSATYVPTLL